MTKTMTVTQLRSNIFDVLTATKVNKQITNIMLHGEIVAEIRPKKVKTKKSLYEIIKNFPKIKGLTQEMAEMNYHDYMMKKHGKGIL